MDLLKDLVKQKFGQQKIYQQAQESLVIAEANKFLAGLLPNTESVLQVIYLKDKILTIAVLDDEFLPKLKQIKLELLDKLNHRFSGKVAIDWKFLI